MIRRVRAWWGRLPPLQQALLGLGVPIAAGAALWANFRQRGAPLPGAGAANGQGPTTGFLAVAPPTPIDTSAAGVAASDLGGFVDAFTGELGSIEGRLAVLEEAGFGQTPGQLVTPEPIEIIVPTPDVKPQPTTPTPNPYTPPPTSTAGAAPSPQGASPLAAGLSPATSGLDACTFSLRVQIAGLLTANGWARLVSLENLDALINTFYGRRGATGCLLNGEEAAMLINHFRVYSTGIYPRAGYDKGGVDAQAAIDINNYLRGIGVTRFTFRL